MDLRPPVFIGRNHFGIKGEAVQKAVAAITDGLEPPRRGFFVGDNLITWGKTLGWTRDKKFSDAFLKHVADPVEKTIAWRTATLLWAVRQSLLVPGDLVECGCYKGATARILYDAADLAALDRKVYLYDLFEGAEGEAKHAMPGHGPDLADAVRARFSDAPNVIVTKGRVPETLANAPERIAFLHIDMNNAVAEVAALDLLFDRVSPGGVVVLDDYGWGYYAEQHDAEKAWFSERGYEVLELPTAQALVVKAPRGEARPLARAGSTAWLEPGNRTESPVELPQPLFIGPKHMGVASSAVSTAVQAICEGMSSPKMGFFAGDNLITWGKALGWAQDSKFAAAFTAHAQGDAEKAMVWRTATLLWALRQSLGTLGDLVECGCSNSVTARILYDAADLRQTDRSLYLYDVFEGPEVSDRFADAPNVIVTRGPMPRTLENAPGRIAFLHIDMNNAAAEVAALDVLFDRVSPGGVVVLDDYGWIGHAAQHEAERAWFSARGYAVLELPTGQGIVVKSPGAPQKA